LTIKITSEVVNIISLLMILYNKITIKEAKINKHSPNKVIKQLLITTTITNYSNIQNTAQS